MRPTPFEGVGIRVRFPELGPSEHNVIARNVITNSADSPFAPFDVETGIWLVSDGSAVKRNVVSGNYTGIYAHGDRSVVVCNIVSRSDGPPLNVFVPGGRVARNEIG